MRKAAVALRIIAALLGFWCGLSAVAIATSGGLVIPATGEILISSLMAWVIATVALFGTAGVVSGLR